MRAVRDDVEANESPKRPLTLSYALLGLAVFASVYCFSYFSLSQNRCAYLVVLALFALLEVVRLLTEFKASPRLAVGCEVLYFVSSFAVFVGMYRRTFAIDRNVLLVTVLYRPYFTMHHRRPLAFILGIAIAVAVLPMASGIITDAGPVALLTWAYAFSVACLWIFCSKLGSILLGVRRSGSH